MRLVQAYYCGNRVNIVFEFQVKLLVPLLLLLCLGCGQDERLICRYPIAKPPAEMSLEILLNGNLRYANGHAVHPNQTAARRALQAEEHQRPLAAVLTCADSRVPVELIFDVGIGDIFVVRSAGNAWNVSNAGSLEYASLALGVPLIVVMGHTNCGAVEAAWLEGRYEGFLYEVLQPVWEVSAAYKKAHPDKSGSHDAEGVQTVTRANVQQTIRDLLANCPEIREKYAQGYLKVLPAEYDLVSGVVTWLDLDEDLVVNAGEDANAM